MLPSLLWQSSTRYHLRHPWLYALSVLGIALGVAVVVAIDLANDSANRAFLLSAESVTGRATHQITGPAGRLDEQVYLQIRTRTGLRASAPVVEGHVQAVPSGQTLQILGIDPIAEEPFRDFSNQDAGIELGPFFSGGNVAYMSASTAESLDLQAGSHFSVLSNGQEFRLEVAGVIEPDNRYSRMALENLLVVDISTAQQLLSMQGLLSRVDLILPEKSEATLPAYSPGIRQSIEALLPPGAQIETAGARSETLAQLTRAFELNLRALSMLALLVGLFLIYNTITFTVVQRRPLIGRLRALGITGRETGWMIAGESLLIGIPGTLLGLLGGYVLSQGLLMLVTRTINDLYFVLSVQQVFVEPSTLAKGVLLGTGSALVAAIGPAVDAARTPVRMVLQRSERDSALQRYPGRFLLASALLMALGIAILLLPGQSIYIAYGSLLCMISAFALVVPRLVGWMSAALRPLAGRLFGYTGRMAVRGIVSEIGRTSVAIAALAVAVAAAIGVGLMVNSFRSTVDSWLTAQLEADIYIQAPALVSRTGDGQLDAELVALLRAAPGVAGSRTVQRSTIRTELGESNATIIETGPLANASYRFRESVPRFWERFEQERVLMVSESWAFHNGRVSGDSLQLSTAQGPVTFLIGAVYYDYTTDTGLISLNRPVFDRYFNERFYSGLALYLDPGIDTEAMSARLREMASGRQIITVQSSQGLREASMEIFDQTFTVTVVLRLLAVVVAFIGILSAFMALQLERAREMAVLRANGMTPAELWRYVTIRTSSMGLMAGLLSLPLGIVMAAVLIRVINLRSFGWSLDLQVPPELLLQAIAVSVSASVLAGLYPSWKMAQAKPADALRYE